MNVNHFGISGMGLLFLTFFPSIGSAFGIITDPVAAGTPYRLIFVTNLTYTASSSDITTYNAEVNTEANSIPGLSALGLTWTVLGSTASVDAFDNIGGTFTDGVYDLEGNLIASGSAGLWSGGIQHGITFDENGNLESGFTWTGSNTNGSANSNSLGAGSGSTEVGQIGMTATRWCCFTSSSQSTQDHLFAISSLDTNGTSAPEPGTLGMIALAGAGLVLRRLRNRQDRPLP